MKVDPSKLDRSGTGPCFDAEASRLPRHQPLRDWVTTSDRRVSPDDASPDGIEALELPGASVSALTVSRDSGEPIASVTPDRALAPASTTKLLASGLALEYLGPDHRYETTVAGRGRVDGRILEGDLILVGSGAPDLEVGDLEALAAGVVEHVDRVTGDVVVDGQRFTGGFIGPGWTWVDVRKAYGAPSSAVALERNQLTVRVTGGESERDQPTVDVKPEPTNLDLNLDVETRANESADVSGETDVCSETIHIEGVVRPETATTNGSDTETVSVPVARPENHCGEIFQTALGTAGVPVDGGVEVGVGPDVEPAFAVTVESAPIRELLETMNVSSDNFVAEQLARTVARQTRGDGSWDAWESVVGEHLRELGHEAFRIRDGSGLSRYNLLSAAALVDHLRWVDDQPWASTLFDSLPEPGRGTLDDRLDGVPVAAKTGTLTGSSALAGVLERPDATDVLFGILESGLTEPVESMARDRQDQLLTDLARH